MTFNAFYDLKNVFYAFGFTDSVRCSFSQLWLSTLKQRNTTKKCNWKSKVSNRIVKNQIDFIAKIVINLIDFEINFDGKECWIAKH